VKEKDDGVFFSSQKKKNIEKKRMQRREGTYLSSLSFAFGMKRSTCVDFPRSFNVELPTFLKPCVAKFCATQAHEFY
jgi:hypothetical protein